MPLFINNEEIDQLITMKDTMHKINVVAVAALLSLAFFVGFAIPVSAQSVTAFEGARLIVGDGRVIENATLVMPVPLPRFDRRFFLPRSTP